MKKIHKLGLLMAFMLTALSWQTGWGQVVYTQNFTANAGSWTGPSQFTGATACGGSGGALRANLYSGNTVVNYASPLLGTAIAAVTTVTFDYKVANWSANTAGTPTTFGTALVQWSNSASGPWTTVGTINGTNHTVSGSCANRTYTFTPTAGTLYMRLNVTWNAGDYYFNLDNFSVTQPLPPCASPAVAGTVTSSSGIVTVGQTTTLSLIGAANTTGLVYQWESAPVSTGVFSPIAGATTSTYVATITTSNFYRCNVSCTNDGSSAYAAQAVVYALPATLDYGVVRTTGTGFTSIAGAGGGSPLSWGGTSTDDQLSNALTIPFPFIYQGVPATSLKVCTNGWMTLNGGAVTSSSYTNTDAISGTLNTMLAPWWDDLVCAGNPATLAGLNASMAYKVDGAAPNRILTIEWSGMEQYGHAGPNLNFQVKLYETTNNIEFVYGNMTGWDGTSNGGTSVVGWTATNWLTGFQTTQASNMFISLQQFDTDVFSRTTRQDNLNKPHSCFTTYTFTPGGTLPAGTPLPAITNNEVAGAVVITTGLNAPSTFCNNYSLVGATASSGILACTVSSATATSTANDVWFTFTVPTGEDGDYRVRVAPSFNIDAVVQYFDAGMVSLGCENSAGTGLLESLGMPTLAENTTYYVRVYHNANTAVTASPASRYFSLDIYKEEPPVNNNCSAAIALTVGQTCSNSLFSSTGGSPSVPAPPACSGVNFDDDVWFSFVANATSVNVSVTGFAASYNPAFQVLSGACGMTATSASLACVNANTAGTSEFSTITGLTCGTTYFIRVAHAGLASSNDGRFRICLTSNPCGALTAVTTTNITGASANIGWTAPTCGVVNNYTYTVSNSVTGATATGTATTVTPSVSLTGLAAGTTYNVTVQANCATGTATPVVSSFTTFGCGSTATNSPANAATNVARNLTLSWAAVSGATGYNVYLNAGTAPATTLVVTTTSTSYVVPSPFLAANTAYVWRIDPIDGAGNPITCTDLTFTTGASLAYCTPTYATGCAAGNDGVSNVTIGSLSNASGCPADPYYEFFVTATIPNLEQLSANNLSITFGSDGSQFAGVWIDYNQNGTFEASEGIVTTATAGSFGTAVVVINVPITALTGQTRMRIRGGEDTQLTTGQACGASSNSYGETEDYIVNITPAQPCNLVAPGNTTASRTSVCSLVGSAVTFGIQTPASGTGVSYQWQSSPDGISYTDVIGATATSYAATLSTDGYYRALVSCSASGNTATSTAIQITKSLLDCYCTTTNAGGSCITNVTLASMTATSTGCSGGANNYSRPGSTTSLYAGVPYTGSLTLDAAGIASIWVDYNRNGVFDASEWVQPFTSATTGAFTLNVPLSAVTGTTGMRVRTRGTGSANGSGDACTAFFSGETEDFEVTILQQPACSGTVTPGTASANISTICGTGNTAAVNVNVTGYSLGLGQTFNWQESTNGVSYNFTSGVALSSPSFSFTPTSTTYYRCVVECSGVTATTNVVTVTAVTPAITSISGPSTGIAPQTLTYTATGLVGGIQWQFGSNGVTFTDIAGVTTNPALLSANSAGIYYIRAVASLPGCASVTSNVVSTTVTIQGDNVCDAVSVTTGLNGPFTNVNYTIETGEPAPPATGCAVQDGWCNNTLSNTVWLMYVPTTSGCYTVSLTGGTVADQQMAIYSAASCSAMLSGGSTLIAANDDGVFVSLAPAIVQVNLVAGTTYYIQVDAYSTTSSGFSIRIQNTSVALATTVTNAVCTPNSGRVVAAATGGYTAYSYSNNGGTGQASGSFTGLTAGNYTIAVRDAYGCSATSATTVTYTAPTQVSVITTPIANRTTICSGSSTNLAAAPSTGSYRWSNSAFTQSITVNSANTYRVTYTDVAGCTTTASQAIAVTTVTIASSSTATNATATQGIASVTASGGAAPYTYRWSTGATGTSITGAAGAYIVSATDANGCVGVDIARIFSNTPVDNDLPCNYKPLTNLGPVPASNGGTTNCYSVFGNNIGASFFRDPTTCGTPGVDRGVFYAFRMPDCSGTTPGVKISTNNVGTTMLGTNVAVYTVTNPGSCSSVSYNLVGCNSSSNVAGCSGASGSLNHGTLEFAQGALVSGGSYYIYVSGDNGSEGNFELTFEYTQSAGISVAAGPTPGQAVVNMPANGQSQFKVQWRPVGSTGWATSALLTGLSYTLPANSLMPGVSYEFRALYQCSGTNFVLMSSNIVNFATVPTVSTCAAVSGLSCNNVSGSVTTTWSPVPAGTSSRVTVAIRNGASNLAGSTVASTVTSVVFANRPTATSMQVQSSCGGAAYIAYSNCAVSAAGQAAAVQPVTFEYNGITYEGIDFNDPQWGLFGAQPEGDFTMSVANGQLIITDESVKTSGFDFELRPSVAMDFTNVVISTEKAVDAQLSLSDMNGTVLNTRMMKGVQNGTVVTLETSELPAGLYIVSIRNEEGAVAKKLVVVK